MVSQQIPFTLEVACYSPESAILAAEAGAHRIELCDNPDDGGTTPSFGVLKNVRKFITIPVFPIIRPRGGHFVFSTLEIETMKDDILLCKQLGYEGVVIGLLNENGTIDYDNTARLVALAYPLEVTFHRAFDRTSDPLHALELIIKSGCNRLLTSGQRPNVNEANVTIKALIDQSDNRIIVMPGSGVRAQGIFELAEKTGATEFHTSARKIQTEKFYIPESMRESLQQTMVDPIEIKSLLKELNRYFQVS